ncbi:hypothetical protein [Nocardiopsis sp. HUAS JQ3]|uniref:hypothetical protein n=1 Tax=Nocardiopsis sp. HUAS JQ3 TaxID=3061629 RepID=UPI0023A9D227|nr:hypothetical protein [Nocardiopsis sp. HUAS JQ3]WDZ93516.1 hypothetical protein PV789_13650 [Nocardiopsis sp. HUAS JQ3]
MDVPSILAALFIAVVVTLMGLFVWNASTERRSRAASMSSWARQHGWRFEESAPYLADRLEGYPFVRGDAERRAENVLSGRHRGREFLLYDRTHITSQPGQGAFGWRERTVAVTEVQLHSDAVLACHERRPSLPAFDLEDTTEVSTGDDVFDADFRTLASDPEAARAILTPEVRRWLRERPPLARLPFRCTGSRLIMWENTNRTTVNALRGADQLTELLERVPENAWHTSST